MEQENDWVSDDSDWSHKAWMSQRDADLFESILLSMARSKSGPCEVLEWGSGKSTRYFTNLLDKERLRFRWLSLEYDRNFFHSLEIEPDASAIATSIRYLPPNYVVDPDIAAVEPAENSVLEYVVFDYGKLLPMLAAHAEDRKVRMADYVALPGLLKRQFDLILVDGRHRRQCLVNSVSWISASGVVVLHDAYRPYYHCAFDAYPWKKFVGDMLWLGARSPISALGNRPQ